MTVEKNLQHSGAVITVVYADRFFALDVATKRFQARSWGVQVQHGIMCDILVAVYECETYFLRRGTQIECMSSGYLEHFNLWAGKLQDIE
jgi:hypothetical protein